MTSCHYSVILCHKGQLSAIHTQIGFMNALGFEIFQIILTHHSLMTNKIEQWGIDVFGGDGWKIIHLKWILAHFFHQEKVNVLELKYIG